MIDAHCHLEQEAYDKDREQVIETLKKNMDALVTSCAHPEDFDLTLKMRKSHPYFINIAIGCHPEYVKELKKEEIDTLKQKIKDNKNDIAAIGEIGLDYYWTKEEEWQQKQRDLFQEFITLAKQLNKPIVIHSRNIFDETLDILEKNECKDVLLHLWSSKNETERIIRLGYYISLGPILLRSKTLKKLCRDMPIDRIMTETDSPWFGDEGERNTPLAVKKVIERIAEIKNMKIDEVDRITTSNAKRFFSIG